MALSLSLVMLRLLYSINVAWTQTANSSAPPVQLSLLYLPAMNMSMCTWHAGALLHNQILPMFFSGVINGLSQKEARSTRDSFGNPTIFLCRGCKLWPATKCKCVMEKDASVLSIGNGCSVCMCKIIAAWAGHMQVQIENMTPVLWWFSVGSGVCVEPWMQPVNAGVETHGEGRRVIRYNCHCGRAT